jgi:alkylresorcinol/alkylpyrone synthase
MDQSRIVDWVMRQDFSSRSKKYYERFMLDPGIRTRAFGLESLEQLFLETPDLAVARFNRVAVDLAVRAARQTLEASAFVPADIDGLVIVTCTGYLCPGLTSYVGQALGLRPDIFLLDMVGHGCGAAVPGLRIADQFVSVHPSSKVLLIAVEVCSATFVHGESIDLLLSNSIFADGAAACLVSSDGRPGWSMEQHTCLLYPEHREELRFKTLNARLTNVLGKAVPGIVARGVKELVADMGIVQLPEILFFHPGGRMILDIVEKEAHIPPAMLEPSRAVLAEYGNTSSPSVLYVLQRVMDTQRLPDRTPALMVSYGAGLSINGLRLCWTEGKE